ncbi:MAG: PD40 domain-containing protein, partial [Ignavibacteriales bacterium]|nr:PD40 domain-containing protein [Ignavibacteriales bacterium]
MKQCFLLFYICTVMLFAQNKKEMTFEDMWLMQRIGDVVLSPDGKLLAFSSTSYSLDLNKGNSDIFIMNANGTGLTKVLGTEKSESAPKFTPDGTKLSFLKEGQIWTCNADGSAPEKITDIYTGVDGYVWSPDGKKLLFTSAVYPECSNDECNKNRDEQKEKNKVKASIFTELMYRHWNDWRGEKRSHLFYYNIETKQSVDVTLNSRNDVPPLALGSANDFSFSPSGDEVAFTMNPDKVVALSTNNEIYTVKVQDILKGGAVPTTLISSSKGNDFQPVYSPDGNYLVYCSMERAGFEADQHRLMLYDRKTGKTSNLSKNLTVSADEVVWSPDSKTIYFNAAREVHESVYKIDVATGKTELIVKQYSNNNLIVSPDGGKLFCKQQRTNLPFEIFSFSTSGENLTQLSAINKPILDRIEMNPAETFWSKGADGTP